MESAVRELFGRYESFFNRALGGDVDAEEFASLYAPEFIGAAPAGVMTGKNDEQFRQAMTQGYAHYRDIGTKEMRLRHVGILAIDEYHCLAHVAWTATYTREKQADVALDFDVHYLVQKLDEEAKVFGWISGDEQALLKEHGIL